jgi:hypothetical protein
MIVGYLNVMCSVGSPLKAHTIPVVDSDTVLPFPVSLESLQPIRGRNSQVVKGNSSLKLIQLPQSNLGHVCPFPVLARGKQLKRVFNSEANDHTSIV